MSVKVVFRRIILKIIQMNSSNFPLPLLHLKIELSAWRVQTMVDPDVCSSSQPSPRLSKICKMIDNYYYSNNNMRWGDSEESHNTMYV